VGSIEAEWHQRPADQPIIESVACHAISMAETAARKRAEGIVRKKSQATPPPQAYVGSRAGSVCPGATRKVSELGERQAERIIGSLRVEDIQFHHGQDLGGSEAAGCAA